MKARNIIDSIPLRNATLVLLSVATITGLSLVISGCGRDVDAGPSESAEQPVNVFVKDIAAEKRALPIRSSGRLSTKAEVRLSFKIGGLVDRVFVDEGQRVKRGALLARLNLAEIDAQVMQAKSGLEKSKRDRDRAEGLYADSVILIILY